MDEFTGTKKTMQEKLAELQHDKKVLTIAIAVIITLVMANYLWSNRGGTFMVQACNDDSAKCYTLSAKLSAEWRAAEGTLFFSNGGSLHFSCSEDFGCVDSDDTSWTIRKINRL